MRPSTPFVATAVAIGAVRALRRLPSARDIELRFRPPTGHDPAAALSALRGAGFTADLDFVHGDVDVVTTCPAQEREAVRKVLRGAPGNMNGDDLGGPRVRFADE